MVNIITNRPTTTKGYFKKMIICWNIRKSRIIFFSPFGEKWSKAGTRRPATSSKQSLTNFKHIWRRTDSTTMCGHNQGIIKITFRTLPPRGHNATSLKQVREKQSLTNFKHSWRRTNSTTTWCHNLWTRNHQNEARKAKMQKAVMNWSNRMSPTT